MYKQKRLFIYLTPVLMCLFIFAANFEAAAHKPLISGNFEQGQRVYSGEEGRGDNYLFKDGWLKIKQNTAQNSYYYVRVGYTENNFIEKNVYDSQKLDLDCNYTRQIIKPLRFKTDLSFKHVSYPVANEKNYRQLALAVEMNYKLNKQNDFTCSVKLQEEAYPLSDKDNLSGGINLKW